MNIGTIFANWLADKVSKKHLFGRTGAINRLFVSPIVWDSRGMPREKRHYRRSRIPESKFWELVRYFAEDLSAAEVTNLIGLTRNSVTNILLRLRRRIERASKSSGGSFRRKSIESFWNFAQRHLEKFNGVPHRTFHFHLKESEWRFNLANRSIYAELLRLIEERPL